MPGTISDPTRMSLERLRELLVEKGTLRDHRAVPVPKGGEGNEIKNESEDTIVYASLRPVERSRPEERVPFLSLLQ